MLRIRQTNQTANRRTKQDHWLCCDIIHHVRNWRVIITVNCVASQLSWSSIALVTAEVTGSNPVEALKFFHASSFQLLKLEMRWSLFTFIYNRSTIWISQHLMYVNIYTLFDGLAYNTCGYFASCVVFGKYEQWAKCPLVLHAEPSNKRFIIPLQKKLLFCNWLLFFR